MTATPVRFQPESNPKSWPNLRLDATKARGRQQPGPREQLDTAASGDRNDTGCRENPLCVFLVCLALAGQALQVLPIRQILELNCPAPTRMGKGVISTRWDVVSDAGWENRRAREYPASNFQGTFALSQLIPGRPCVPHPLQSNRAATVRGNPIFPDFRTEYRISSLVCPPRDGKCSGPPTRRRATFTLGRFP